MSLKLIKTHENIKKKSKNDIIIIINILKLFYKKGYTHMIELIIFDNSTIFVDKKI